VNGTATPRQESKVAEPAHLTSIIWSPVCVLASSNTARLKYRPRSAQVSSSSRPSRTSTGENSRTKVQNVGVDSSVNRVRLLSLTCEDWYCVSWHQAILGVRTAASRRQYRNDVIVSWPAYSPHPRRTQLASNLRSSTSRICDILLADTIQTLLSACGR
jgi:hypothetical protein